MPSPRLPAPVRSLFAAPFRAFSQRHADPLEILFCGSDDFSIASLHALHQAKHDTPGLIGDIHVAHRPAKPTGRGLKTLREVPIASTARALSLPTHTLDTFTHWTPPTTPSLIIAVSFGLLIPARILRLATHGGLNVHPSLLPDLRGSSPIEHALLQQRTHTGVSVQTLHPTTFDAGVVLAQTPAPGLRISAHEDAATLRARLADAGARMLVDVLKQGLFVQPVEARGWYAGPVAYAPKLGKGDAFVDYKRMGLERILAMRRALGDLWCVLPWGERLVVHEVVEVRGVETDSDGVQTGLWCSDERPELLFRAACGRIGGIASSTYPGGKAGKGNAKVKKLLQARTGL